MTISRILATSAGFSADPRWGSMRPAGTFKRGLELATSRPEAGARPRVTLVMTASSDDTDYLLRSYEAIGSLGGVDVTHVSVSPMPNADPRERILNADLIWVGGGSVANLLALWALHGIDNLMREAYANGTILAGVSAGSICWHVGGPTDSFGLDLRAVTNGLGLLPFGNGVHYDSEAQRRPLLQRLVSEGTLPTSYATDDRVGLLYENGVAVEVVTDREVDPESGPAAYLVEKSGEQVNETRLAPGRIT